MRFRGKPPYPIVKNIEKEALEHINNVLDGYQIKNRETMTLNPIVGYLKEFREQQESGETSYELPNRSEI